MAKEKYSVGDALLCTAISARLGNTQAVRRTAKRVQKRLHKANQWPFAAIARSKTPKDDVFKLVKELTNDPTKVPRLD